MRGRAILGMLLLASLVSGCSVAGPVADELNPYGEGNSVSTLGARDNSAVLGASGGGSQEAERARHALEVMGSYRRAQAPQPVYPVIQPAEVRLMWIPDHLNIHGDLVPAHYYYLRVLNDRWAVQDAFEMESQLHGPGINYGGGGGAAAYGPAGGGAGAGAPPASYGTGTAGGSTPWVYKEE
ncbi:MAG: hypothetical protein KDD69_00870 [Bdellovibrionales bacterium]|nr:hypothetical protein [Bdellovibrionales bacterium]